MGYTAALHESLLQSHVPHVLHLLPALPAQLARGSGERGGGFFRDLRSRGGLVTSAVWDRSGAVRACVLHTGPARHPFHAAARSSGSGGGRGGGGGRAVREHVPGFFSARRYPSSDSAAGEEEVADDGSIQLFVVSPNKLRLNVGLTGEACVHTVLSDKSVSDIIPIAFLTDHLIEIKIVTFPCKVFFCDEETNEESCRDAIKSISSPS